MTQNAASLATDDVFQIQSLRPAIRSIRIRETHLLKLTKAFKAALGTPSTTAQPEPVVIDLIDIADSGKWVDFPALVSLMRNYNFDPIAVARGNPQQLDQAREARIAIIEADAFMPTPEPAPRPAAPAVQPELAPVAPAPTEAGPVAPKVLRQPVRSGAEVYAPKSDLVVISMVSPGARVVADGSIYVHGPLKGTAAAGVSGMAEARIFCESFEPEIIAINGVYLDGEQLANHPAWGKRVLVELDQEQNLQVRTFD